MKVALDTNRYTDFRRGEPSIKVILESADSIHLPFIVVAELRSGFAAGNRAAANEALLDEFVRENDVQVIFPDHQSIIRYANLFVQLRKAGKKIPTHDLWIAAIVLQH